MKKLIVLSVACFFAIGTFANTGHKTKQEAAKTKPATEKQAPAKTEKQVPAKTENKPEAKKDAKGTKPVKEVKMTEVKKTATEKK